MHLRSTGMSWDKYPAKDTSLEDIEIDNVNRYIKKARETGRKKVGDDEEYLRSLNLNERQIRAVMYVKEIGPVTNKEYQEVCATSKRTASRDLLDLVSYGIFKQIGTIGTGTAYIPKGPYGAIKGPNLDNGVVVNYVMFESLVGKVR